MNILIISDYNIAGQPTALMRAINKHTPHSARCIITNDDQFQYDYDILMTQANMQEATDLVHNWAEFYHFGSFIFNWPNVDFNKILGTRNCCIKYYGTFLRQDGARIRDYHRKTGIAAITGNDFTITGLLDGSYYHINSYFTAYSDLPRKEIPFCRPFDGEVLKICAGSAGNPIKRYDLFVEAVNELNKEGFDVELDLISGVSNKEALERKLDCQATFTSLHGGWGISGVESMFMGHAVLACLDPFVLSMFPDQPALLVNSKEMIKERIKALFYPGVWTGISKRSRSRSEPCGAACLGFSATNSTRQ